jgi:putative ABC transport system permease protein
MFTRRHRPADFSAEIEAHIALEADRLRSEGLSDTEARAQARRTFGNALLAQQRYYESRHSPGWDRFRMALLGLFAVLALTLACIGIYGVMAYAVAQRSSEIGIRMALGAQPVQILKLVMGAGLRLAACGIALGAILSLGLNRFLASALYGVRPTDAATFIAAAVLLMSVAVLASYIPARRAMSIDPVVALRAD